MNQRGQSILEVLVAMGLLAIGVMAFAFSSKLTTTGIRNVASVSARDRAVSTLILNIRSNPKLYQVTNVPVGTLAPNGKLVSENLLSNLPLAWSKNFVGPVDQCVSCAGRMGYVIQPVDTLPGMFQITVRVTSSDLYSGARRDYQFLATLN
ncbi:MAG: prepilin-type N-terminal cleavage/methylation domain-containing protein [Deltaproteobacteria bacterium]|nr:prepilin-type N-terminal cleavage/methylation domain-containing protein [Deltaproteobacteria bacterium]MBI3294493.1 prepilin-type N-terminal cleavage/methylation domain-containing protein [Deltaproteobacteria bacterium]